MQSPEKLKGAVLIPNHDNMHARGVQKEGGGQEGVRGAQHLLHSCVIRRLCVTVNALHIKAIITPLPSGC